MSRTLRASAPGTLMLLGEHAVLHGHPALAFAVSLRLDVVLSARSDRQVYVRSALGTARTDLDAFRVEAPFHFLLGAVRPWIPRLREGLDLTVTSSFPPTLGLGSSAAIVAAATAALAAWTGDTPAQDDLFRRGLAVVREVQGAASGSDLAAAIHGGVVLRNPASDAAVPLAARGPITVVYSGYKTPTPEVIRRVNALRQRHPGLVADLFAEMGRCVRNAVPALEADDWETVGAILDVHHELQRALGTSTRELEHIVGVLRSRPGIFGAKISGSGLGDCALGVGRGKGPRGYRAVRTGISPEGVRVDHPA